MSQKNIIVLAVLGSLVFVALGLVGGGWLRAGVQISRYGDWQVSGTGGNGAVGDTVPIDFSVNFVEERCANAEVYFETTHEAREKTSLVSALLPTNVASSSPERIEWSPTEIEAGEVNKYRVQVRIDRGDVGDEISGFYVHAYCPSTNTGIFFDVVDDIKINIIGTPTATKKPVATPVVKKTTPTPTPIIKKPTLSPIPLPAKTSVAPTKPASVTISNATPVPLKSEIQNDVVTEKTTESAEATQAEPETQSDKKSFVGRVGAHFVEGFRAIGSWFADLF